MENQATQHTPDYLDDPSKYYTALEWQNLSRYEKIRIQNTYEIYVEMVKSGFHMSKPEFMTRNCETNHDEQKLNNKLKRKNTEVSENTRKKRVTARKVNEKKARYPKRNQPPKNYRETDIIPDDYYIYCEVCMNEFAGECKIHTPTFLTDTPIPMIPENLDRAKQTVPEGWLTVSSSKIRDGGDGVWALRKIKKGIRFGPYEGIYNEQDVAGEYSWQIKRDGKVICYIDGQDTSKSNWMRYVNCARYKAEQNLAAYQYRGKIYYRVVADIDPGTELFVFYGTQFARELGIDTKNYNSPSPPKTSFKNNIFECQTCHLAFSSPIYLKNHISRCRDKKITETKIQPQQKNNDASGSANNHESYKCHLCDRIYTIKPLYRHHLWQKHYIYDNKENKEHKRSENADDSETSSEASYTEEFNNKCRQRKFKCSQCSKAFQNRFELERHSRVHTGERPFTCETCKKTFTLKHNLNRHILTHTGERPHECDTCHKTFTQLSYLIQHKRIHNNIHPYECPKCNKTFTTNCELTVHIRYHTGEKPYQCKLCTYQATQSANLTYHMRTHTGEKPYQCKQCTYQATNSSHLTSHMRIHTGEKPYQCKLCTYQATQSASLTYHMRTHTGEKPYQCKQCTYQATNSSHLTSHMRIHTGEKPYQCKLCTYQATQSASLTYHMRTHTGEKPYQCKQCTYQATNSSHLTSHMRIHTGEKPYQCKLCTYQATQSANLTYHMRTHTGEKPYQCKLCTYQATQSYDLTRHMRIHTGEKPYTCKHCQKAFTRSYSLKSHIVKLHPNENST